MLSILVILLEPNEFSPQVLKHMHPLLQDVKNLVLDTLFPVYCLSCGQEGIFLCLSCQDQLHRLPFQQCLLCQQPSQAGATHPSCKGDATPDRLISVFDYHDPLVAQAIIFGKYKFLPEVYRLLARLMIKHLRDNNYYSVAHQPMLCPVPLAQERLRWRGFNQSLIVAQELNHEFDWPITNVLARVKNTRIQKDLTKTERQDNIAHSFAVTDPQQVRSRNIILVDDVTTTGATLLEAVKITKLSGAAEVGCLTLARD